MKNVLKLAAFMAAFALTAGFALPMQSVSDTSFAITANAEDEEEYTEGVSGGLYYV